MFELMHKGRYKFRTIVMPIQIPAHTCILDAVNMRDKTITKAILLLLHPTSHSNAIECVFASECTYLQKYNFQKLIS